MHFFSLEPAEHFQLQCQASAHTAYSSLSIPLYEQTVSALRQCECTISMLIKRPLSSLIPQVVDGTCSLFIHRALQSHAVIKNAVIKM